MTEEEQIFIERIFALPDRYGDVKFREVLDILNEYVDYRNSKKFKETVSNIKLDYNLKGIEYNPIEYPKFVEVNYPDPNEQNELFKAVRKANPELVKQVKNNTNKMYWNEKDDAGKLILRKD
jgi:hypothetical protein